MPISATACRTSSTLNGLMTAVISFMRLSPLSPVNDTASDAASAYYDLEQCSFRASPYRALNQSVARLKGLPCTDMARHAPYGALRECEALQILEIEMSFIN